MDRIYSELYDLVEGKMKENNRSMACTKDTFLTVLQSEAAALDGNLIESLEHRSYLETAYMILLKRLPESTAVEAWETYMEHSSEKRFRRELLTSLISSGEAISKGSCLIHNADLPVKVFCWEALNCEMMQDDPEDEERARNVDPPEEGFKDKLYKAYLKLPEGLRLKIHKLIRKD